MREAIIQIVTGTLGCLGFGVLFNIRGKRLLGAAFGGFLSWTIFLLCGLFSASDPLNYFIAATITTFYGEIMARVLKTPATTFVITSLIPLIPGGSLYYTMAYAYEKSENFLSKGSFYFFMKVY